MKKIILSAIIIMATVISANAQENRWFIGGKAGFWNGKENGTKTTVYTVAPEVGFRFTENIALATYFEYSHFTQKVNGKNTKTDAITIAPYVRYTFFKSGIVNVFVDGAAAFGLSDLDGFEVGIKPGIAMDVTNNLSLVANFGFIGYNNGKGVGRSTFGKGFKIDMSGYQSTIGFYLSI
ncbi:MAG: hypothetical protein LBH30_03810 [Prevotellaceae bacterium]|jgi:hypothetical protein|nr:hypothetical protein [Prevotellaceae bacterium]